MSCGLSCIPPSYIPFSRTWKNWDARPLFQPRTQTGMLWLLPAKSRKRRKPRGLAATQKERAKGLEPSTSSLGIGRGVVLSAGNKGVTSRRKSRCTDCCTGEGAGESARPPQPCGSRRRTARNRGTHASPAVPEGVIDLARQLASLPPEALAALRVLLGGPTRGAGVGSDQDR